MKMTNKYFVYANGRLINQNALSKCEAQKLADNLSSDKDIDVEIGIHWQDYFISDEKLSPCGRYEMASDYNNHCDNCGSITDERQIEIFDYEKYSFFFCVNCASNYCDDEMQERLAYLAGLKNDG